MRARRPATALLAAAIALVLGGAVPLAVRAQEPPPTGKEVALGLEAACPDRSETLVVADFDRREVLGRWIKVDGPTFGLDPMAPRPGLKAHAVDPGDPRRLFASEGHAIARSLDGGCTWTEVHFVAPQPAAELLAEYSSGSIIQLVVSGTGPESRVWAMWAPQPNTTGPIRMFVSDDGGDTWEERSDGLAPAYYKPTDVAGGPVFVVGLGCDGPGCERTEVLAVAPSDPNVAYIGLSSAANPTSFFSTTDGGRTWLNSIGQRGVICCNVNFTDLAVDPRDPESIWLIEGKRLAHSSDGGRSFAAVDVSADTSVGVAGLHLSRDSVEDLNVSVFVRRAGGERPEFEFDSVARSTDGGETFGATELVAPVAGVPAVAHGGDAAEILLTTASPDDVVRYRQTDATTVSLGHAGLGKVTDPHRDQTAEPATWVRGFADFAAFVPGPLPGGRFPPRPRFDPVSGRLADRPPVPGDLFPAALERDLGAEGSQTVDYRLDLPSLPTPVDVWFLVDTSSSMAGAHRGLQIGIRDIVTQLAAIGLDAWYGVGVFPDGSNVPYGRYADLAPPGGELYEAIDRLGTTGGGNELHPTALYQTVTGAGQPDADLPPGLGASFRPEALKIIVHASDEPYGFDPDGPTFDEAADALVAARVHHVGLDLTDGATVPVANGFVSGLRRDHDEMAIATSTFAPAGGVDCNGDGRNELEEGDPLTCAINRLTDTVDIAPTIVAAVSAVRDDTAVALTVAEPGGLGVDIAEPMRSPVNVKRPNSLPFAVRFTCPAEKTGQVTDVLLRATVRGAPSAEATARIGCGAPVPPPPRPQPRPLAPLVPLVLAPPQLVPDLEPAISPLNQTAPAQVAQPTPQPGLAAQPGEVATAKQSAGRDGPAPRRESDDGDAGVPGAGATLAGGAVLAAGFGAWATRRERAHARQRA